MQLESQEEKMDKICQRNHRRKLLELESDSSLQIKGAH